MQTLQTISPKTYILILLQIKSVPLPFVHQYPKKRIIPLNQMPIRQHYFLCFIKYIVIILLIKKESINKIHVEVLLSIEKEKKKTFEVIIL